MGTDSYGFKCMNAKRSLRDIYTDQELGRLCEILAHYFLEAKSSVKLNINDLESFYAYARSASAEPVVRMLLEGILPLEELPLMLDVKTRYFQDILKWRLEIGK